MKSHRFHVAIAAIAIILPAYLNASGQSVRQTLLPDTYISPLHQYYQAPAISIDFSADTYLKYSNTETRKSIKSIETPTTTVRDMPSFKYDRSSATRDMLTGCGILLMGAAQCIIYPDYPVYRTQPFITVPPPYRQ